MHLWLHLETEEQFWKYQKTIRMCLGVQLTGSEIVIECDRRADVQAEREVPVGYFVVAVLFDNGGLRTGRTPRKRSGNEHVAAFLCT